MAFYIEILYFDVRKTVFVVDKLFLSEFKTKVLLGTWLDANCKMCFENKFDIV